MINDLISRKAAIEAVNISNEEYHPLDRHGIIIARVEAGKRIREIPSITAVPLDNLCEWLSSMDKMDCRICKSTVGPCKAEDSFSICNSKERWKEIFLKWMEKRNEKH